MTRAKGQTITIQCFNGRIRLKETRFESLNISSLGLTLPACNVNVLFSVQHAEDMISRETRKYISGVKGSWYLLSTIVS